MRHLTVVANLFIVCTWLSSCQPVDRLRFTAGSTADLSSDGDSSWLHVGIPSPSEDRPAAADPKPFATMFRLRPPLIGAGQALFATARSVQPEIRVVFSGAGNRLSGVFRTSGQPGTIIRNVVPLSAFSPLEAIELSAKGTGSAWFGEFAIGPAPEWYEFSWDHYDLPLDGWLTTSTEKTVTILLPPNHQTITFNLNRTASAGVTFDVHTASGNRRYQTFGNRPDYRAYLVTAPSKPTEITVAGLPVVSQPSGVPPILFRWQSGPLPQFPRPITLDMQAILHRSPEQFRRPDLEVYRWSLFPNIVYIVFRDLAIQDRYLKRLAFFVEKLGARGQLLSDAQMANRHGWNAHDYNATGLAKFFSAARLAGFPLNQQERELEQWCLEWGVLQKSATDFEPGVGGILSFSYDQSLGAISRQLLIGHESMHGLFYELPALRKAAEGAWQKLDAEIKDIFIGFFRANGYDPADDYLMVNEYQAYLLQQPRAELSQFVHEHLFALMTRLNLGRADELRRLENRAAEQFLSDRDVFSQIVRESTGLEPPYLFELAVAPR